MYKFCKSNSGWWRVCSSLNELLEWHEQTCNRYGRALLEDVYGTGDKYENIRKLAYIYGKSLKTSFIEGLSVLSATCLEGQMKALAEGEEIWINPNGGWNCGLHAVATVHMKKNVFPDFKKSDIRILKYGPYEQGKHFYAYIGDIQIYSFDRKGNKIVKWNTKDAAYEAALRYCNELQEE